MKAQKKAPADLVNQTRAPTHHTKNTTQIIAACANSTGATAQFDAENLVDSAPTESTQAQPTTPVAMDAATPANKPTNTHHSHPADQAEQPEAPHNPVNSDGGALVFTAIQSDKPTRLAKVIGLNADGTMRKVTAAHMTYGRSARVECSDLAALRDTLDGLTQAQAVVWGRTSAAQAALCTQGDTQAIEAGAIARTRDNFAYPNGPGVMMLDHDGLPGAALSGEQFRQRLIDACPILEVAPMLWRPSASAGCIRPDGSVLSPLTRHRLYLAVQDASLIPQAGKAIEALLWARPGDGWVEIGKAGQALLRCLVDTSVWQPERLDFAGASVLEDGVTRPGTAGVIYGDPQGQFDLQVIIDAATETVHKKAAAAQRAAKKATEPERKAKAEFWASDNAPKLAASRGIKTAQAVAVLERAAVHSVLMGDFELMHSSGDTVSVAALLDNPQQWHGQRFADPLDPDHDKRVSIAYLLNGDRARLYSHKHGGMHYELRRQSARVLLGRGLRVESTDAVLRVLRERNELFDFGDKAMAYVAEGHANPVGRDWLIDHLGRACEFYSLKTTTDDEGNKTTRELPEDANPVIAGAILAKHGSRHFRKLTAVCTAPILRPDGSIFDIPGHDPATGLLYATTEVNPPRVPVSPTPAQALDALALLWHPLRLFPLVDDVARGVVLQALLSGVLRPSLPTCPGTGFDAPTAASGKTLLARCIGMLATGQDSPILPPATEEDECRKRLTTALRSGRAVLIWDNIRDAFGNAAIDAFLTAANYNDRILGVSEDVMLPNRSLFLCTGNNLTLTGDTFRRILIARIDAQDEKPYTREFDFDPLHLMERDRQKLAVAALTIVRAYITAGRPKTAPGRTASFEQWDDLVRQPLCWLAGIAAQSGRTDLPGFADPVEAINRAASVNPETAKLSAMLTAWDAEFRDQPQRVADVIAACKRVLNEPIMLKDAADEIAGQRGDINPRMLGRWIERHAEQRHNGMRFVRAGVYKGYVRWQVQRTTPQGAGVGVVGSGGFVSDGFASNAGPTEPAKPATIEVYL